MKNETTKISWRRVATIAMALVVVIAAAYTVNFPYRRDDATPPAKVEESPSRQPPVASISFLPREAREALVSLCSPCSFADSGASWNPSDVIDDHLPRRRLIKTEKSGQDWLVQYEYGGIAVQNYTAVFSLTPTIHLAKGSSCIPSQETCKW
ncbi:MAG TPA: hypothetical protein VFI26_06130 [Lysobacter sp.]|nr:hypothetical protein [Lysobacter sp.]